MIAPRCAIAFLLVMIALPPARLAAQEPATVPLETAIAAAAEAVRARQRVPALSIAVGRSGAVIYERGFGTADLENDVPAGADTRYRTASIAKPMTAVAVMQLVEAEKLSLDDPIQRHCPEFPAKEWPITIRQLLGHLGGVRHYQRAGEAAGTVFHATLAHSVALFRDDPLVAEPGTTYRYTTYGYTLLGRAIETASGLSYESYMRERVFGPAGMMRTVVDSQLRIIPDRARGYRELDAAYRATLPEELRSELKVGDILNAALHDTSMKVPGGGLLATAGDLVRFGLAVMTAQIVAPATRDAMWTMQTTTDGKATGYGLGWSLGELGGRARVAHGGRQAGARCYLVLIPQAEVAVAIMSNMEDARLEELAGEVVRRVVSP